MLGGKTNHLVRKARDYRQQGNAQQEACHEGVRRKQHVDQDRDDHYGHQEAGSTAWVKRRVSLHILRFERIARLESENRFVLGSVVLVDAANVGHQRDSPDKEQEERNADDAVDYIEQDLVAERRINVLEFGGRDQWNKLVQKDKKSNRENDIYRGYPATDFGLLARFTLIDRNRVERHIGRIAERAEAQHHRLAKRDDATYDRPTHPLVLFREPVERLGIGRNRTVGPADGDSPGVRRAHHDAFEHGLTADQRLLAAFESGQQLDGDEKA